MRRFIIIFLGIAIVVLTYFTSYFIEKKQWSNRDLMLAEENQELRAQIQRCSIGGFGGRQSEGYGKFLNARVFSTYPFNIKNELAIDSGESQGVRDSMLVTLGGSILVGRINKVFNNSSVVQTVFDPNFEMPVRIGPSEVDGLFEGGGEPKVVLIEKSKIVRVGDFIYSAGSEAPYGLKIGEVAEIKMNTAGVFKEAVVKMPFNVNELREVNIVLP